MKCICVNDLTTLVVFEAQTGARDEGGGRTNEWSMVYDAWAKVEPVRGRERFTGGKLQGENPHVLTVRLDPSIMLDNALRVRFTDVFGVDRKLNVRAVVDIENKHEWLEVYAEEGVGT